MKCNRCSRQARSGFKLCRRCQQPRYLDPDRIEYTPIDEILASSKVRILRALLRLDWCGVDTLQEALDTFENEQSYNAICSVLYRLVSNGFVERRGRIRDYEYRITPSGRAELARRLQTDMAVEDDGYRETA
jgi:hypothetical protein